MHVNRERLECRAMSVQEWAVWFHSAVGAGRSRCQWECKEVVESWASVYVLRESESEIVQGVSAEEHWEDS